jgi:aryl-alcohol dehydrogenase-like predicted oxidoreductase
MAGPSGVGPIPQRQFGRHAGVAVSALGFGGHHLGDAADAPTAIRLVQEAVDGGITFFDNCWEYHRGKTEVWMGQGLKGRRDRAFLMTKVCTHGRDGRLAYEMLGQSLRRLQTDHLDLWQVHGVVFDNDPELFIRPGGAADALTRAKQEGLVRFVGFSGHKNPHLHLAMLNVGFEWDAVQMPLNPFDATFNSFETLVLPELNRRGIAALGMKPLLGHGAAITAGVFTAEEMLRYAMSLPVTTTISGVDTLEVLRQNLGVAQGFTPLSTPELQQLRERARPEAADGHFELYKLSLRFDNPEARLAHDFPLDLQSVEVKEMVEASKNDGFPFPKVQS